MSKYFYISLFLLLPLLGAAANVQVATTLEAALHQAATEQKSLFFIFGRASCEHCQALHDLIDHHRLNLPPSSFIVATLNCDDHDQAAAFLGKYKVDGDELPFVVIARADGKLIASRTGSGTEAEFNAFIESARNANEGKQ